MTLGGMWRLLCVAFFWDHVTTSDDVIRGTYHAWWVIIPLPITNVREMVKYTSTDPPVELIRPPWEAWPEDKHPVLMEIGRELDCGPVHPSWLRSNFMEYKFDIPFVRREEGGARREAGGAPLNYKVVLYEDSEVNSVSSELVYKLNATKAAMRMTDTTYTISKNNARFSAIFSSNITWFLASAMPEFQVYKDIARLEWFGGKGPVTCAEHLYDFQSAKIRPAAVLSMTLTPDLLNKFFPEYKFRTNPLSGVEFFGSIEVMTNFTMSLPHPCT